ncbi:hypothetical protein N0V90_010223 [Kalmusia sp. IMI 367209]|nr:hypothetical protein N0V90_010223 [Kalmusia sp. IMI 367209]
MSCDFCHHPRSHTREAFLDPAQGASATVDIASPLSDDAGADHYGYTIKSLKAVIYAAEKIASVKRVVWTGSTAGAVVPFQYMRPTSTDDEPSVADGETDHGVPPEVPSNAPGFEKYARGKAAGLDFLRPHAKDHPTLTSSIISQDGYWVQVRSFLLKRVPRIVSHYRASSSVPTMGWFFLMGVAPQNWKNAPLVSTVVHDDDVAEAHTKAITVNISAKQKTYVLSAGGINGVEHNDAAGIAKKSFPELAGKIDPDAHFGTVGSYEDMVVDTIRWYTLIPTQRSS